MLPPNCYYGDFSAISWICQFHSSSFLCVSSSLFFNPCLEFFFDLRGNFFCLILVTFNGEYVVFIDPHEGHFYYCHARSAGKCLSLVP
jgi:hypothetical protein